MILILRGFYNLCESIICQYGIFVESEAIFYEDYDDFIASHSDLKWNDQVFISMCINNGICIQINLEVLKNEK